MKHILVTLLLFLSVSSNAVELSEEPIQESLKAEISKPVFALNSDFDDFNNDGNKKAKDFNGSGYKPSVLRAALYSFILPGMGEYYLGNRTKAKYFFAVEVFGWAAFASYRVYGGWKNDDMLGFARSNANAELAGKSDEYVDMVGFYESIDRYNSFGRAFDPEREYLDDTPENHWRWQSDKEQAIFRNLKNRSREAFRRSEFTLGLLLLNRIVSVIDAVRDARRSQRVIDEFSNMDNKKIKLSINPFNQKSQFNLTYFPGF